MFTALVNRWLWWGDHATRHRKQVTSHAEQSAARPANKWHAGIGSEPQAGPCRKRLVGGGAFWCATLSRPPPGEPVFPGRLLASLFLFGRLLASPYLWPLATNTTLTHLFFHGKKTAPCSPWRFSIFVRRGLHRQNLLKFRRNSRFRVCANVFDR